MPTVLTVGTFDCLHYGHIRLFDRAAAFGRLTVGVNSDRFVRRYKGRQPVSDENMRAATVAAVRAVHATVVNDGPGRDLVRRALPHLLVVGSDWHGRDYLGQIGMTQNELDYLGVAVMYLPRTPDVSTTEIRERLP